MQKGGDYIYILSYETHENIYQKVAIIIDIFSRIREDFIAK